MHVVCVCLGGDLDHPLAVHIPGVTPAGAHLDGIVAQRQDQIGFFNQRQKVRVCKRRQPRSAKTQGMVFGQDALCFVRRDKGDLMGLKERAQGRPRCLGDGVKANDCKRVFRISQPGVRLRQCRLVWQRGRSTRAADAPLSGRGIRD